MKELENGKKKLLITGMILIIIAVCTAGIFAYGSHKNNQKAAAKVQEESVQRASQEQSLAAQKEQEQKARSIYDNILRVVTDPDVCEPIRFLRKREIVHFQRFGEALRGLQEKLDSRNFYAFNPSFDPQPAAVGNSR